MERFITATRISFGLLVFLWGLNVFLQLIPMPKLAPDALAFWRALQTAGYVLPIAGAISVVCGISCIGNKHTPLALLVLAPVTLNLALFHLFLDLQTGSIAYAMLALNAWLLHAYRGEYEHFLKA